MVLGMSETGFTGVFLIESIVLCGGGASHDDFDCRVLYVVFRANQAYQYDVVWVWEPKFAAQSLLLNNR